MTERNMDLRFGDHDLIQIEKAFNEIGKTSLDRNKF